MYTIMVCVLFYVRFFPKYEKTYEKRLTPMDLDKSIHRILSDLVDKSKSYPHTKSRKYKLYTKLSTLSTEKAGG